MNMRSIKRWGMTLAISSGIILATESCSNNTNGTKSEGKQINTAIINDSERLSVKPVQQQLDKAKAEGKVAFLVLVSKDAAKNKQVYELAQSVQSKVNQSVIINMNRDDTANTAIVKDWQLSGIIPPAIFVVSYKGLPVSGYSLDDAKEDEIIAAIPSPKTDEAYALINESKPVFLVVTKNSFSDKDNIITNCRTASAQLKGKPAIIEVNKEDSREKSLLANFKISPDTHETTVVVINADGQTTDTYNGMVTAGQLVASVKKVVKSACCASGGTCK